MSLEVELMKKTKDSLGNTVSIINWIDESKSSDIIKIKFSFSG